MKALYKENTIGNLIKISTSEIVPRIDGNSLFEEFKIYLENNGTVDFDDTIIEVATIPEKVAKANCKLALIHFGISTSLITKEIHDMPPSLQKDKMIVLWEDTNDFYRKDESLNAMAPIFNITQELLDQVFIYADSL